MKFYTALLCVCILGQASFLNAINILNAIDSAKNVATGVVKDIPNVIPTPNAIFDAGKQVLAGYPFEIVSSAINKICSAALTSKEIKPKVTPDIHKMQFQLRADCERLSFPLLEADTMWRSPKFDVKKKVVILATGWTTTVNDTDTIDEFAKAYKCRGDVNFVALDAASFVDTLYTWSAFNTQAIGEAVAKGLKELTEIVPVENIHLIGHSLGAHIVGYAGRSFQYMTNQSIPRITALDPAKPCFNEGEELSGIQRGDADFIDVVHSNPGVLGRRDPSGDVDFYPGGLTPLPPGCISVSCAHALAWQYYAESVYPGNENNFMGVRCGSLSKLRQNACPGKAYPMGYAVPNNIKGNYFLEVNSEEPFGKFGSTKRQENNKECGSCPKAQTNT